MTIRVNVSGSTNRTRNRLTNFLRRDYLSSLEAYGQMGVEALASATPIETGLTAASWTYKISRRKSGLAIEWNNTNENDGAPVAILIQYGHATGTGGWVEGRDFINPAIQPIFDQIANDVWKKVKRG